MHLTNEEQAILDGESGEGAQKAMELLKTNESKLHRLADYLYTQETITGEQFMNMLNQQ